MVLGIDGMTVEDALPWLKKHIEELLQSIREGSFKPSPVRRKKIPTVGRQGDSTDRCTASAVHFRTSL